MAGMDDNPYKPPDVESDRELDVAQEVGASPPTSSVLMLGSVAVAGTCFLLAYGSYRDRLGLELFFAVNGAAWTMTVIVVLANLRAFIFPSLVANLLAFLSAIVLAPR